LALRLHLRFDRSCFVGDASGPVAMSTPLLRGRSLSFSELL